VNNFAAAYEATRYLINLGHRHIAHITATMPYQEAVHDIQQRYDGYIRAMEEAGLGLDPQLVVQGNLLQQSGVLAIETLLMRGRPFSAIFAANDQMAFGARLALFRRGIRVPDDVSLVGFDDEGSAAYFIPPLTTMRQPGVEMGQTAAQAILDLINDKPVHLPIFTANLIIRESVSRRL
jgi:LacI family transcriptional regulator